MTQPLNLGNLCGSSIPGVRKIILPDGDQVGLIGVDAIMEALYKERKLPDESTAMELITRLRERNYIGDSPKVLELYKKSLLNEYRRFVERRKR